MKRLTTLASASLLLLTTQACGSSVGGAAGETASVEIASGDATTTLAQYRLVVGDFDASNGAPECLALRTKVFAHRKQVQAGSEWRTIVETDACKQLDQIEEQFRNAKCTAAQPRATDACAQLTDQLLEAAQALSQTPQWSTLGANSYWHDLVGDFNKGRSIHCL